MVNVNLSVNVALGLSSESAIPSFLLLLFVIYAAFFLFYSFLFSFWFSFAGSIISVENNFFLFLRNFGFVCLTRTGSFSRKFPLGGVLQRVKAFSTPGWVGF